MIFLNEIFNDLNQIIFYIRQNDILSLDEFLKSMSKDQISVLNIELGTYHPSPSNDYNNFLYSPLVEAAISGNQEIGQLLVNNGAFIIQAHDSCINYKFFFLLRYFLKLKPPNKIKTIQTSNEMIIKNECSICYEKYKINEKIYLLECNHFFHKKCLKMAMKIGNLNSCPLCRKNIN